MKRAHASMGRDWVVVDANDQTLKCLRCAATHPLGLPKDVREFVKDATAFGVLHRNCQEKTHALQGPDSGNIPP